jgi:segregation and condensation protein B
MVSNPAKTPPADPKEPPAAPSAAAIVEALLFTSDSPLSAARIAELAELPNERAVKDAIAALNARYEQQGAAFRIEALAGGYQMLTRPEFHGVVARLLRDRSDSRLSQAALETLAIVAYRQPILRADVEAIRGVACGEVLRGLLERQLIKIAGRAQVIGRPMLYGTTRRFLEVFGLESLDDLPKVEELRTPAATSAAPAPPEPVEGPTPASAPAADAPPSEQPAPPPRPQET